MTQKKKLYESDEFGIIVSAVIVALMFVAGMIYNKDGYLKHRVQKQTEKHSSVNLTQKNIKTFIANDIFRQFSR